MQLYILRHGIAYERHEWSGTEFDRPLTEEGKKRTRQVVEALKDDDKLDVEQIWSSPLVRALETATIASKVLNRPVTVVESLASGTNLQRLELDFKKRKPLPERLMLVGHEPDCGLIIADLVGDSRGDFGLKKAGIAALSGQFEKGGMKLKWLLTPKEVLKE
jgi:phosphohistidine phosphatase